MNSSETDPPPCLIHIDKEGVWRHKGAEMIHREYIRLFYERLALDEHGRYVIDLNGERCLVDVEDTAYVVKRAVLEEDAPQAASRVLLTLSDDSREALDAATLRVGEENVLYCTVKDGRFPARFARPAYYQLAEHVEETEEGFCLELGGRRHPIPILPA